MISTILQVLCLGGNRTDLAVRWRCPRPEVAACRMEVREEAMQPGVGDCRHAVLLQR